jgi:LuxR family transcriptional regulator, maltose regulon positive regulatory protein
MPNVHGAAQLGASGSPLLRAKLRAPAKPPHYVRRPRLLERIGEAVSVPLTVIAAPAGAGKTSLLAGWAAESGVPVAWYSLDETDGDAAQLWPGVIAALDALSPGCGQRALTLLRGRARAADAVCQLLDDLDDADHPSAVLVVDDVHVVDDDAAVTESLALFVQHLPAWLHVVLVSRRDPKLPTDRLRVRGQLAEVRFAQLRLSDDEARELLSQLAPSLSEERLAAAAAAADGWVAGVQITALAVRSARAQADLPARGSGADLLVEDYVWHEVLAGEAPELVEALLDIAVVDRVNPSLGRALTRRPDADDLLLRAEARGLFVTRLDPDGWFQVHSLIRAALVAELGRRSPSRLSEQHRRAARWYEDAGETVLALNHWNLAGLSREALRLLSSEHAALYDSGQEGAVLRALAAIPSNVANTDLETMLEFAWCHLLVSRRRFAEAVEQASWWASRSTVDETGRARLRILQSMAATMSGRWVEGGALARQAMLDLGDASWRDPLGRYAWNMIARDLALSERWDDTDDELRDAQHALSRDHERRIAFEGTRALGEALAGRPVDAVRIAAGVSRAATVTNMTILGAELTTAEALAHLELGDRPRVLIELEALADTLAETVLYCRILAIVSLAEARLDEGDLDAAHRAFARAEALIDSESVGADGRGWLARVGVRMALAAGDIDAARRWSELVDDPFWGGVGVARVHLAVGRHADAAAALDIAVPRCVRHSVVLDLLRARAAAGDDAVKYATAAVELAAAHGMLQTVVSEGDEMPDLIERAAWRAPPVWLDRWRRRAAASRRIPRSGPPSLVEPLTDREREVLRYLPSRLTVREIADELYVSVNTLKFHLKVIYRKLGVSSRAEAAGMARRSAVSRRRT